MMGFAGLIAFFLAWIVREDLRRLDWDSEDEKEHEKVLEERAEMEARGELTMPNSATNKVVPIDDVDQEKVDDKKEA